MFLEGFMGKNFRVIFYDDAGFVTNFPWLVTLDEKKRQHTLQCCCIYSRVIYKLRWISAQPPLEFDVSGATKYLEKL